MSDLIDRATRLMRWGRSTEAAHLFRAACVDGGTEDIRYNAWIGLSQCLQADRDPEALAACREAIAAVPGRPEGHAMLAFILAETGQLEAALAASEEAGRRDGESRATLVLGASIALRLGRPEVAIERAEAALRSNRSFNRARAIHWLARACRAPEAAAIELRQLVQVRIGSDPVSSSFDRALSSAILMSSRLDSAPPGGALKAGSRLHDLTAIQPELSTAMDSLFLDAARSYPGSCDHQALRTRAWANVMGSGAFEAPHIHEGAWLSAVYYPQLPEVKSAGGEIEFGVPEFSIALPFPAYRIRPAVGMTILFPSWLHHSTVPFSGRGTRISIAADVLSG